MIKLTIEDAIILATEMHREQKDKAKKPYILHCLRVMAAVAPYGEPAMMAGVLHDAIEDTELTVQDLVDKGYPQAVCTAVKLLTHDDEDDLPYDQYVRIIYDAWKKGTSGGEIARLVKCADLRDNLDCGRLTKFTEKDAAKTKKRVDALLLLS